MVSRCDVCLHFSFGRGPATVFGAHRREREWRRNVMGVIELATNGHSLIITPHRGTEIDV